MGQPNFWYRDAIYYCLDVKTFKDADGDGWGDLRGLTEQLDYLQWLGVDAIWLLPFYPSPNRDNGYDVTDHYGVDPRFGSPGEFVTLLREAEARGLRVVADLVINHTSNEHPWFVSARQSAKSPFRDFYVWSTDPAAEPPAAKVYPDLVESAWQYEPNAGAYYLHHFFEFQPDLNATHPLVQREIRNIIEYWSRLGVSGFRIDAAPYLSNPREPDERLHEMLENMHRWMVERRPDALVLAEVDLPVEELSAYFGDGDQVQMLFNFVLNQALFLAFATGDAAQIARAIASLPAPPTACHWLNFLRHHDELNLLQLTARQRERVFKAFAPEERMRIFGRGIRRRLAPMFGGDRERIELAFSLLFSLPGAPLLYYGDEIGMGDNLDLPERMPFRTPMQWSGEVAHGGFSTAPAEQLVRPAIDDGPYSFRAVNVETQRADPNSQLTWMRELIHVRKGCPEVGQGEFSVIDSGVKEVFVHRCDGDNGTLLAIHNLGADSHEIALDASLPGLEPVFGGGRCEIEIGKTVAVRIDGYGYCWLRGEKKR